MFYAVYAMWLAAIVTDLTNWMFCRSASTRNTLPSMKTLTLRLPAALLYEIEAESLLP
jgi:hypothetical protein